LTHTESVSYIANATPNLYPFPQEPTPSYSVYGVWGSSNLNEQNQLDLFGYYELNRMRSNSNDYALDRFTFGLNHFGNFNKFSTIVEGAYQVGNSGPYDISAYLVSVQVAHQLNSIKLG